MLENEDKKVVGIGLLVVIGCICASIVLGVTGYTLGWFGEAAQVAQEEFGPRAALEKYEWFKDVAAQLDRKRADINNTEAKIKRFENQYDGKPRSEWPREDREQHSKMADELDGMKSSYNGLAADYNAQMAKFNWRFANEGDLPKGADKPLPREFRTYTSQ